MEEFMIRLGHIEYSNCFPVHARLIAEPLPADIELLTGVPSTLNRALDAGRIDAAPCSSIEYARHAAEYFLLPGFVIGSDGPVHSIRFDSAKPPRLLNGETVFVTDSSATSVVLLRILLERCWNITTHFETFDQSSVDPIAEGAAAALFIGDVALRRPLDAAPSAVDLGAAWREWTGLPFAFAVWQLRREMDPAACERLNAVLHDSRAYFQSEKVTLAERFGPAFGFEAADILAYWTSLRYDLDDRMKQGLLHFLALAAELGEAPPLPDLAFAPVLRNHRAMGQG